ncbi:hypothetical protein PENSPDRAFT_755901 [Peniophora sp. CONT]|nr:hypothetical protein PENSPDRAFT_755901 [Peniophora sp. CONT]
MSSTTTFYHPSSSLVITGDVPTAMVDERGSRSSTPRYIQTVHVDSASGDVAFDTLRLKSAWRFDPPDTARTRGNIIVVPNDDSSSRRHRLAFMGVAKKLQNFRSTRELCKALYDALLAHQALLDKAGILHGDIAPGTIGITYE